MTTALNRPTAMKLILMTIVAGIITGCSCFSRDVDEPVDEEQTRSAAFTGARALYDQGRYEVALERFRLISTADDTEETVLNAKLGVICCGLMLATEPEAYAASLHQWNEFARSIAGIAPSLDFDMIDPVIVRLTTEQVKKEEEKRNESKQLEKQDQKEEAALSDLKKKAKKTNQLQRKLDKVEAENRSLKEKIKALEAIDQSIQKKKSEIESPGG